MQFGGKTGCIEKMFVKLEMTRASPGSSLSVITHFWPKVVSLRFDVTINDL